MSGIHDQNELNRFRQQVHLQGVEEDHYKNEQYKVLKHNKPTY